MIVDQPEGLLKDHPNVTVLVEWAFKTSVLPSFLKEAQALKAHLSVCGERSKSLTKRHGLARNIDCFSV